MSSGIGSLPRARYSRTKRAAILAASASVLTGTSLALPAATFASEVADPAPIVNVDVAETSLDVPDPGLPLPDVELDTDELLIAPVSGALNLSASIDTAPDLADTAPTTTAPSTTAPTTTEPSATAPTTTEPAAAAPAGSAPTTPAPSTTAPSTTAPTTTAPTTTAPAAAPEAAEPAAAEPALSDVAEEAPSQPAWSNIWPVLTLPDADVATRYEALRPNTVRAEPKPAVADKPAAESRPAAATPVVSESIERVVKDERAERELERAVGLDAASAVETEEAAPARAKGGLGLSAPLTDVGPRGVETVDLAARNAPDSSMGDWNLMPEVLFAAVPLFLAGAAVAAHGRRNARVAAGNVGVVQRGRHASS